MFLQGTYIYQREPVKAARILFYGNKTDREVILLDENGVVMSAYRQFGTRQFMALSDIAASVTVRVNKALSKIKKSGGDPVSYNDCPAMEFYSKTRNAEITVVSDRHAVFKVSVDMDIRLTIAEDSDGNEKRFIPIQNIPYVELSGAVSKDSNEIIVRGVEEIKLTKRELGWLDKVTNIVEQDDAKAEEFFTFLEGYKGGIAYDIESTGLKINCFGKINSKYAKILEEYNATAAAPVCADRLCGIIFCVEPNKATYFPCFSRKFKVLYEEDTPTRRAVINKIRSRYTVGDKWDATGDMADFIRSGVELPPDVILMERVRDILEKGYIVTHRGSIEWKAGMLYDIVTNIRDDTILLHQILYRYGPTDSRKSDLKSLSWRELGIDQWSLEDFFPEYKDDEDNARIRTDSQVGKKNKKKKGANIDFSYMELDGTHIYAPADGYCTYQLWQKYKADLKTNWTQMERIYLVEVAALPGVAYCEFYGHRLDVSAIEKTKQAFIEQAALLESKVRSAAELSGESENRLRRMLELAGMNEESDTLRELSDAEKELRVEALSIGSAKLAADIKEIVSMDMFNIGSSKQLCALFYDKMEMPETSKGRSVAKDAIKALMEHKNPDGSLKYPIVKYYQEYKAADTLLTKFFDNLQDYMYPGGFIFSSYGQIAAATGRMSCIAEGELVTLADDKRPIEQVKLGDLVYCYDENRNLHIRPVVAVLDKGIQECVEVRWKSRGIQSEGSLICTATHRLQSTNRGWVRADKLNADALLVGLLVSKDLPFRRDAEVVSVTPVGVRHVYDLSIEEHHNFIASGISVKNCKQPNAQQYPKPITKIVVPRDNCVMMDADYSQIEYRVLVALAKEPGLMKAFFDPDNDYHTLMASIMYGVPYDAVTPEMRGDAKRFNFGIPYGMGIGSIAMGLFGENTSKTREMAKQKRKLYFKDQPLVEQFFEKVKEAAVVYGYTETAFNRRRYYTFTSNNSDKANAAKAAAQRQAGNAVIQGTAADIFKIALARCMRYIIRNNLLGKVFITNMVHDELLFEIDTTHVDVLRATCDIVGQMEFSLEGYPPLFVGAGVGSAWGVAKSKDAEIHPYLMDALTSEAESHDLHTPSKDPDKWILWFGERVMNFRRDKIIAYLQDPANFGQNIHPEIGNLIRLQFGKFISGDDINPKDPGADAERTLRCVEYISDSFELGLDRTHYTATATSVAADDVEDNEYEDGTDSSGETLDLADSDFEMLDDDKLSGVRLQDLIREFGYIVAPSLRVCGIDDEVLTRAKREEVYGYLLNTKQCSADDEGALELVLHLGGGVLKHTGVYVNNLDVGAEIERRLVSV